MGSGSYRTLIKIEVKSFQCFSKKVKVSHNRPRWPVGFRVS